MKRNDEYRIGQRVGQTRWQIKQAPNWRVAHQVDSLEQAASWLGERGVDIGRVSVLTGWPWRTLAEHIAGGARGDAAESDA